MNFPSLIQPIQHTHTVLQQQSSGAISRWLVTYYIIDPEQKGEDKTKYGDRPVQKFTDTIEQESLSFMNLKLFRQLYFTNPQFGESVITRFGLPVEEVQKKDDNPLISICWRPPMVEYVGMTN